MFEGVTVRIAADRWIRGGMNAIPTDMIGKLMINDPDEWREVTTPHIGDIAYVFDSGDEGEIGGYEEESGLYTIDLFDNGGEIKITADDFEVQWCNETMLPMWGTMWSFADIADTEWMVDGGIQVLSACGFRVYESDDFGFYFGIDGAGYDFYEKHWIPLYKARGLMWHDPKLEEETE